MSTTIPRGAFLAIFGLNLLLALASANPIVYHEESLAPASYTNTPTTRSKWGNYSIDTNYYEEWPSTGVTREYWLEITNTTLAPDGYERQVLVFNNSIPGPTLEANWGDNLIIHVTNKMQDNGTSIHWHGLRQLYSNEYDGVPGVTQCPTVTNGTSTYRFQATEYGTTWYHSHYSLQYGDGIQGALVIHGPATMDYDIDLGPVLFNDWSHLTTFIVNAIPVAGAAALDNTLINGMNTYNCTVGGPDPNCKSNGAYWQTTFTPGKKHLLRLINTGIDQYLRISIDNHNFTIIQNDFVPIVPYETDSVLLMIGQRLTIVVEANQPIGNYFLRADWMTTCQNPSNLRVDNDLAIIHYEGAPNVTAANTTGGDWPNVCADNSELEFIPHVNVSIDSFAQDQTAHDLYINFAYENFVVLWHVNTSDLYLDNGSPTLQLLIRGESIFPTKYNVFDIPQKDEWVYFIIQEQSGFSTSHPMHLHGHDFLILGAGDGNYKDSNATLRTNNPPRRDTATLRGTGWLAIAFKTDNPGTWIMHCHVAWHASQGLALQFVERGSEVAATIQDRQQIDDTCSAYNADIPNQYYGQTDSGI